MPDADTRAVFEMEFALMRALVEGDVEAQITRLGETYAPLPDPEPESSPE